MRLACRQENIINFYLAAFNFRWLDVDQVPNTVKARDAAGMAVDISLALMLMVALSAYNKSE